MPNFDRTGPRGKGPKKVDRGFPKKDGSGDGRGKRGQGRRQGRSRRGVLGNKK